MSDTKELTYQEVAAHNTKKDLYLVVHDKIYDASVFVDEHPGGEEVLLDLAGQDSTEAFEDVGHSDEAREILEGLLIGKLKRVPGDPAPKVADPSTAASTANASQGNTASLGVGLYTFVLLGGALAYYAYNYLQAASEGQ